MKTEELSLEEKVTVAAKQATKATVKFAKEEPLLALGIAFGVGVVLGGSTVTRRLAFKALRIGGRMAVSTLTSQYINV